MNVDFVVSNEFKLKRWAYEAINRWIIDNEKKQKDDNSIKIEKYKIQQKLFQEKNISNVSKYKSQIDDNDWEYIYNFNDKSRAFVPIQTGCNHYCSFCIVPFTRGQFKSYNPNHIIEQIKIFVDNGYNEVVLTGIDITDYGKDVKGKQDIDTLGKLCRTILKNTKLPRLRLSSVDVAEIDEDIIDLVANEQRFMPYFHISLQSGSDSVLRRMRRRHTYDDVEKFCSKVLKFREECAFGADIIAGFPGETEEEFLQSVKIVNNAPITFVHAFPYSKREKTLASLMDDNVPKKIKKERVNTLIDIGLENLQKMYKKMNGTVQKVLVERDGFCRAENFVRIKIESSKKYSSGSVIEAKVVLNNDKNLLLIK